MRELSAECHYRIGDILHDTEDKKIYLIVGIDKTKQEYKVKGLNGDNINEKIGWRYANYYCCWVA